jgi:hypothetical protein
VSPRALTAALTTAALLALGGCGSGGTTTSASTATVAAPRTPSAAKPSPAAPGGREESRAPKGASATLRQIYRQFSAPKPNPAVAGSAAAIKAGEAACAGKTPRQVKAAFYAKALASGGLEAGGEEAKMIAKLGSFEAHAATDSAFTAGQLAADTYQASLPEAIAQFGYQGCVYSLARGLERELGPQK